MDCAETSETIESTLKLDWQPVAVRFFALGEKRPAGLLSRTKKLTLCQSIVAAGYGGYPLLVSEDNLSCAYAKLALGMIDPAKDGEAMAAMAKRHVGVYARDAERAQKLIAAKPALPPGSVRAVGVAPLRRANFVPDALLLLTLPWQAYFATAAYVYASGDVPLTFEIGANSLVCAYSVVQAGYRKRIAMATACAGGRLYAGVEKTQLFLSLPWEKVEDLVTGLAARAKNNPYPGLIAMPSPTPLPPKHILQP